MRQTPPPMPFERSLTRRFPLPASGRVAVRVDNGALQVEGWDRPEAALDITIRADGSAKLQLTVVERYEPVPAYDYRRDGPGPNFWPARTLVTLRLPRVAALALRSHNADFTLAGPVGAVDATTFNGTLRFVLARGADQRIEARRRAEASLGAGARRVTLDSFIGEVEVR